MRRGEVWWVNFEPALGGEIRKKRPAVIVSNDAANKHLNRVQVVPLSSRAGKVYPSEALVTFAEARGVTLVPELDAPGHTTAMRRAMPDLFGPPNLSVINLGKEDVFKAIETILSELCEIFHTSPYVHIGADEAYFTPLARDAQAKKAIEQKGYDNVHDLFYEYPPSRARSRAYSCACPMTLGAAGTGQNSASS